MERGKLHGCTANLHWFQHGEWIQCTSAADVDLNIQEAGLCNVRGEFPGDSPPGLAAPHDAQFVLHAEAIHLHHAAVDREVEFRTQPVLHVVRPFMHFGHRGALAAIGRHGNAPSRERVQQLPLRFEGQDGGRRHGHRVSEETKWPVRRNGRIELPKRARSGIARVGEHRLTGGHPFLIQPLEEAEGQVALAANLDKRRHVITAQPQRDVTQRAQVGRHVLTHDAIAARGPRGEHAFLVGEAHGCAVDLELGHIPATARVPANEPLDALLPLVELLLVHCVAQRDHGHQVRMLGEGACRFGADAHGGRVGGEQLRVLALQGLELAKAGIVLRVRKRGTIEGVIVVGCLMKQRTKFRGAPLGCHGGHGDGPVSPLLLPRAPASPRSPGVRVPHPPPWEVASRPRSAPHHARSDRACVA